MAVNNLQSKAQKLAVLVTAVLPQQALERLCPAALAPHDRLQVM